MAPNHANGRCNNPEPTSTTCVTFQHDKFVVLTDNLLRMLAERTWFRPHVVLAKATRDARGRQRARGCERATRKGSSPLRPRQPDRDATSTAGTLAHVAFEAKRLTDYGTPP